MNTHLYELKNIEMGRQLRSYLRKARAEGTSFRKIAKALSEKGTYVGHTSVENWCRALGIK